MQDANLLIPLSIVTLTIFLATLVARTSGSVFALGF